MYTCIYCDAKIVKRSSEHIIHAALGSSFKSDKIICGDCNNYFSTKESGDIDKKFVEQFDVIRNLLNVKTDRGNLPPTIRRLKYGVDEVTLAPGGKPVYLKSTREVIEDGEGNIQIAITSPSIKKGKEQLEHIKRQYNKEFVIEQSVLKNEYAKTPIRFGFELGGETKTKAVAKMVYNFLHFLDREALIDLSEIDWYDLKQYLRYNSASSKVETGYDFINEIPIMIPEDDFSNYIFVKGSNKKRMIFGQVVVFGNFRFSTIIHENYSGSDFKFGVKQPLNSKQKEFLSYFETKEFNAKVLKDRLPYAKSNREKVGEALGKILREYHKKAMKNAIARITTEVIEEVLAGYEGEYITQEHQKKIYSKAAERIGFLINRIDTERPINIEDSR